MKHDGPVNGAVLTKDEARILSWSDDNTARLWNVATGQQIGPAMKHDDFVRGALLTKDETPILSWSTDSTLRLWDVATGQQIAPAMKHDFIVNGALWRDLDCLSHCLGTHEAGAAPLPERGRRLSRVGRRHCLSSVGQERRSDPRRGTAGLLAEPWWPRRYCAPDRYDGCGEGA
jgi:hypothetical protein